MTEKKIILEHPNYSNINFTQEEVEQNIEYGPFRKIVANLVCKILENSKQGKYPTEFEYGLLAALMEMNIKLKKSLNKKCKQSTSRKRTKLD